MAGELQGRIAVITAAASGMGREAALLFAHEGAHVVAVDIDEAALGRLAEEAGEGVETRVADLTKLDAVDGLAAAIGDAHGRIDVLWNHAGAPGPRGFEFDADAWQFSVDLNLRAPVFLTKAAMPLLARSEAGSVIFTSSISAVIASRNSPVYAALKAGVVGFMRCVAAIGAADGIRANAIMPGATETPMLQKFFAAPGESADVLEQRLTSFYGAVPLGRTCRPDEVAQLGLFLASDRSSFITGVAIPIDGGYVAL